MKTTWVIVADEAIARVLHRSPKHRLEPVQEFADPEAHARTADARRDAQGRRAAGSPPRGTGGQHGFAHGASATASAGADADREHLEAGAFARRIAEWLRYATLAGHFDELHIAAAPRFLGLLRKALHQETARRVVRTHDKDWVQVDNEDLLTRFFPEEAPH